jgi:DNA-binding NtrC family response regulator
LSAPSTTPASALLFGSSSVIIQLLHFARRFALARWPVLILGERGTGKTALASWIHDLSRPRQPFVKVSVASIPPGMEHSYLAGHVRGAFTGAVADRTGLFESANRGTFFLDELGLATPNVQGVLLELLDDGQLTRLGGERPSRVDVRLIAATNANLDEMIAENMFRADLRDRFGYLILRMPALAARRDEILPLASHFMARYAAELQLAQAPTLSDSVRDCLRDAPWRGNIRELESVCQYFMLLAEPGHPITLDQLPAAFLNAGLKPPRRRLSDHEIQTALDKHAGNRTRAAKAVGISREHLQRRIRSA